VSKVREVELRLQKTEQQLRLFQKISRLMVREMSLPEVLQGIVSLIVEFMECDSCLVYLLDRDELVLCASNTPHPSTIGKVRLRLSEGLTGWVARERRILSISREAYKDTRFKYFGELPEDSCESFLSAPVLARNRVVGVINGQHRAAHQHTGSEIELLTTVGEQVGGVWVLARMEPTAVAEAKARFSEVIERARSDGPQVITRRGRKAVVVVAAEEWERKVERKGNLAEFFAASPLRGSGITIKRTQDGPREIAL